PGSARRRPGDGVMPQPPNMQQLLKQAQKMQEDMLAAQESLKDEIVEASAGGGMVSVKVTGDLEIKEIKIDPQAVDPDDVELLQDMVLAAVNEGMRAAQELAASKMGSIAGGLGGPGGLGGLGLPGF
ncbi:MAG TPA: YbaB/EbfC family nucleoid-associated protein, partial [Solirubrobacteraceae bacterium]|nr:YbaB/EbfC family nucleoid-associated protein [Solirubrobacteraceae bacterium]